MLLHQLWVVSNVGGPTLALSTNPPVFFMMPKFWNTTVVPQWFNPCLISMRETSGLYRHMINPELKNEIKELKKKDG